MSFHEGLDDMVGNYMMNLLDIIGAKDGEAINNHTMSHSSFCPKYFSALNFKDSLTKKLFFTTLEAASQFQSCTIF